MRCSAHPLVSPNRRSKATERLRTGAGPIRGRNTKHKRLLLDQPSRVVPGLVFQLSYRRLPVCQLEEKRPLPAACWEDCCFFLYRTWITRSHKDRGCFFLFHSHVSCQLPRVICLYVLVCAQDARNKLPLARLKLLAFYRVGAADVSWRPEDDCRWTAFRRGH